jgi:glutamine cyclotransferase
VTQDGQPLVHLNELECAGGAIWANVWLTDRIVRIDPTSGVVTAVVDASNLKRPRTAGVLNGIAYDPAAGTFLLTGKHWPRMYEVRFVVLAHDRNSVSGEYAADAYRGYSPSTQMLIDIVSLRSSFQK